MRRSVSVLAVVCAVAGLTGFGAGPATAAPACGPSYSNPLPATPWPLRRLNPSAAWPLSRGGGVTVAVIDSGVSTNHPKLAGSVLQGKDFLGTGPGTCDADGHGTAVAGIIAATDAGGSSQSAPFYGMAPDAKILPVRVLLDSKPTSDDTLPGRIADAIVWATDHGATVINMSLTTPPTQKLADAVVYAQGKDVVLVAAAGNEGGTAYGNGALYPAAYPGVVAVAGIDQDGKHVKTSNTGNNITISAPGLYIEGPATQGGGYVVEAGGGTSFAAAYVSGVAALIRSRQSDLSADQVIRRLRLTADPPPKSPDPEFGAGVVNPYRAVSALLAGTDTVPAPRAAAAPAPVPMPDPLATAKRVALWTVPAGCGIALALLVVAALRRRGSPTGPDRLEPQAVGDTYQPVIGDRLVISAPTVRRGS
jgi:type VII secretion-associated serine protease mycosin